jgi:hypothetical protein
MSIDACLHTLKSFSIFINPNRNITSLQMVEQNPEMSAPAEGAIKKNFALLHCLCSIQ